MSKKRHQGRPSGKSQASLAKRRMYIHRVTLLLTVAVITAAAFFLLHEKPTEAQSPGPPVTKESVAAPETKGGFDRLKGRWRRPDGGYVIDISEVDASGKIVARYYNPRPINVARAEASQEGTTAKVFIELRDTNYPGSTYTLTYNPESDQINGVYFQAVQQQTFDVVFVRMK